MKCYNLLDIEKKDKQYILMCQNPKTGKTFRLYAFDNRLSFSEGLGYDVVKNDLCKLGKFPKILVSYVNVEKENKKYFNVWDCYIM